MKDKYDKYGVNVYIVGLDFELFGLLQIISNNTIWMLIVCFFYVNLNPTPNPQVSFVPQQSV